MAIPATVGAGFQILRLLSARDAQGVSALATNQGRKRIAKLFASPADPCAQAIAAWERKAQSRVQGTRAMCWFRDLAEGRVAVLDMVLERGGWRLEDVRIVEGSEFTGFGKLDEPPSNVIG